MSAAPSFSVIVVCKDPGPALQRALDSVWAQRDAAWELIVVDGGSTDGTREWLEQNRARIAALIMEPDRGIYDAMNKGIACATGDWIYFLGADDRLAGAHVLAETASWCNRSNPQVLSGDAIFDDGRRYRAATKPNPVARNFAHHQALFYRRALFSEHGRFDARLGIMADYDFNLRLWRRGVPFTPIPVSVAQCGSGGRSDSGKWEGYREEIVVRHRHFPSIRCIAWDVLSAARFIRKKILRTTSPRG